MTIAEENRKGVNMRNEFSAIVERDGVWFIAYCPEIPGANGQGKTKEESLQSLSQAIKLILEDRRQDALRGIPPDAIDFIGNKRLIFSQRRRERKEKLFL